MKEELRVFTSFSNGAIKPLYFVWNQNRIKIENITYGWRVIDENGVNIHFSAISGSFYYHIVYIPRTSRWYLIEIESVLS